MNTYVLTCLFWVQIPFDMQIFGGYLILYYVGNNKTIIILNVSQIIYYTYN